MKWYHHHNRSVVTSTQGNSLIYYEAIDGRVIQTKDHLRDYHREWIDKGDWIWITENEAYDIISSVLGKRYPEDLDLSGCFTTIDIHMFSSGKPNEL